MTNEDFHMARYKGVLAVMKKEREKYEALWKNFKNLQSEHNTLKTTYLNLLDGHVDIIDGKNKTIRRLRAKINIQKDTIQNYKTVTGFEYD